MKKRKLLIGTYDTDLEGLWTLSELKLGLPELKEEYVDIPGRNGKLDLSTVLTDGEPQYGNRMFEALLESSEGTRTERNGRISYMVNLLDGLKFNIILPDDPMHYLHGRVRVEKQYSDLVHAAVKVTATCDPWLYNVAETQVTLEATSTMQAATLYNKGRKSVTPTVEVIGGPVEIKFGEGSWVISEGTYIIPEIFLKTGSYPIQYKGTGMILITYREAVIE